MMFELNIYKNISILLSFDNNNTLSCPRNEGTIDQYPLPIPYPTFEVFPWLFNFVIFIKLILNARYLDYYRYFL